MKKIWHFIAEDDSIWSMLANIVIAFVLIKFIVYPVLGLVLGTQFPVVAVVSGSMEHNGLGFNEWWEAKNEEYVRYSISGEDFEEYSFHNGFNTGDIMVLMGKDAEKIDRGDIIVFRSKRPDPIIHRVVSKRIIVDGDNIEYRFQTKGDNNKISIDDSTLNEKNIKEEDIIGKAVFRIPYLGWIKIGVFKLLGLY